MLGQIPDLAELAPASLKARIQTSRPADPPCSPADCQLSLHPPLLSPGRRGTTVRVDLAAGSPAAEALLADHRRLRPSIWCGSKGKALAPRVLGSCRVCRQDRGPAASLEFDLEVPLEGLMLPATLEVGIALLGPDGHAVSLLPCFASGLVLPTDRCWWGRRCLCCLPLQPLPP